ncbi:hypothetical protein BDR04DRAFT_1226109 [Suillus decipiens]|nr:hypothetical protein BDR04DRAFT_1226109 [Suillus decipiens]
MALQLQNPAIDIIQLEGGLILAPTPLHLLVSDAYRYLLGCSKAIQHLAKMTLASSSVTIDPEDVQDRIQGITKFLNSRFPVIVLKQLSNTYGTTPMPESFPGYNLSQPTPFLDLPSLERQKWRLQFYLDVGLCNLYLRATTDRAISIFAFFLHVTIINELCHVVMLVFSTEPTVTKFRGYQGMEDNPLGLNRHGVSVEQGESGDSMENVMIGGDVVLLIPKGQVMGSCDPNTAAVDVGVICDDGMRVIGSSPYLSEIASGKWDRISTQLPQPIPSYLAHSRTKISQYPPSPSSSVSPDTVTVENDPDLLVINPDRFLLSGAGQTDYHARVAGMLVSVRAATGRPDLVAVLSSSTGLAPGEKR